MRLSDYILNPTRRLVWRADAQRRRLSTDQRRMELFRWRIERECPVFLILFSVLCLASRAFRLARKFSCTLSSVFQEGQSILRPVFLLLSPPFSSFFPRPFLPTPSPHCRPQPEHNNKTNIVRRLRSAHLPTPNPDLPTLELGNQDHNLASLRAGFGSGCGCRNENGNGKVGSEGGRDGFV